MKSENDSRVRAATWELQIANCRMQSLLQNPFSTLPRFSQNLDFAGDFTNPQEHTRAWRGVLQEPPQSEIFNLQSLLQNPFSELICAPPASGIVGIAAWHRICLLSIVYMSTDLPVLRHGLQCQLFPLLEEQIGPLGDKDRMFLDVLALLPDDLGLQRYGWCGNGRPPASRFWLFHSFVAKAVHGFATTKGLIDELRSRPTLRRLCGWETVSEIPEECTFSLAFGDFAADQLPQRIHETMVNIHCGPKLVGHVSHDSTAIEAREKRAPAAPAPAPDTPPAPPRKRGRPKQGQQPPPPPPKRLELQPQRSLAENLADLPQVCDNGCKTGSKGQPEYWRGYKLHLGVIDGDIPVSAILTSASTHDSQAAIPLMQMSAGRVRWLYDLADAAYDARAIHQFSRGLGHVPIIEPVQRGDWIPLDPAQRQRFGQRSADGRVNGRLKDEFGGRLVRVRGALKVMAHLMFGVLVITALGIWSRLC